MATYDPAVIATMTDRYYQQATSIVTTYILTGAGAGVGLGLLLTFDWNAPALVSLGVIVTLLAIGGWFGRSYGERAALALRFQAQQALVLAEIERHTRQGTGGRQ